MLSHRCPFILVAFFAVAWTAFLSLNAKAGDKQSPRAKTQTIRIASLSILPAKWDKVANAEAIENMVRAAAKRGAKLIVTPEGVLEGYVVNEVIREKNPDKKRRLIKRFHNLAEPLDGKYVARFCNLAKELQVFLILCFLERDGDRLYNTAVLIGPGGRVIGRYRKTHFAQGYECNPPGYTAGKHYPVFDLGFMKIGIMICFDRQLPEPARLLTLGGADLIACPAYGNWGKFNTWRMRIRANENDVPVVFTHPKQSLIIDRRGNVLAEVNQSSAMVLRDIPISLSSRNGRLSNRRPETYRNVSKNIAK